MENVVVLSFKAVREANEAFQNLQHLDEVGDVRVEAAATVERAKDGRTVVLEVSEDTHGRGAAAAGAIGGILGLATGPLGAVVGGATGAFVGSLVDVADVESTEQLLRVVRHTIPPGSSATIAVLSETDPDAIDSVASHLGGTVLRRARRDVEAKLGEAEAKEMAARREAASQRTIGDRLRDLKDAVRDR